MSEWNITHRPANALFEVQSQQNGLCVIFHSGIFHYRELPLLNIPLGSNQGFSTSYKYVIIYVLNWDFDLKSWIGDTFTYITHGKMPQQLG